MSNTVQRLPVLIFGFASLGAVVCGAATLAAAGVPPGSWLRNPVAWLVGALLAWGLMRLRRSLPLARSFLGLALVAIGGSFLASPQEGVHRWIDLGPLHVNVAALFLPAAIVALAFCGILSRLGVAFAAAIAVLLVLQPDASQATSFVAAVLVLLARSTAPNGLRFTAMAAALFVAVLSWSRPDPLESVPEVEGIFPLAFAVSPVLAIAAAFGLAVASLAPLAMRAPADGSQETAALALTAYFVCAAICPIFGAFPVPLVGLGMSFPVGYWLGIALLSRAGACGADRLESASTRQ